MTKIIVLAALFALGGCAEVRHRAVVSVDEYASYKKFRVAPTVEQKLAASYEYLRKNPRGGYRAEVLGWFSPAEPRYLRSSWEDPRGLETFLKSVPEGRSADLAAKRLVELRLTAEYRRQHEQKFTEHVEALESRLATAESGRRDLVNGVAAWVRKLSSIRSWGKRTSELNDDLIFAYRLSEPAARCGEDSCTKTVSVSYGVPEGKVQSAREAIYDVGLKLDKGGVQAAWITGPELFTRLGEAVQVAAVSSTDLVARAEAIGSAVQVIGLAAEARLPASRCTVEAVSPVVLERRCDGVTLRMISAVELGEEDRIVVEPVSP